MHVLWISDSPDTPSGFGNVTRFVCDGLAQRGHRVDILGWQTKVASAWHDCNVLPIRRDPLGSDVVYGYLVRHRPNVVIALADVWWLPVFAAPHVRQQLELTRTPWVLYFPIDGETENGLLPPSWVELLSEVDVPVAMSQYGAEVAGRCGIRCETIPHGVDLEIFAPPEDRALAKGMLGFGDSFVVLSDSRNQPRKLLPRLLDVFGRFAERRPNVLLHLHTDPDDEFADTREYSYDVRADVRHLGLEERVRFTPGFAMRESGGVPLDQLAGYYRAADVHFLASSGEGFGLPTLQALAAGTVPLATAYSASRELVEGHGESVAVAEYGSNEFGIQRALIDVDDAVAKLVRLYDDPEDLQRRSERCRAFALKYDWDRIVDRWDSLIRSLAPARSVAAELGSWRRHRGDERVVEQRLKTSPGTSVTVKVIERVLGRLEASIVSDASRASSDVRLPTVPPPCDLGTVRAHRRPGYVCVARADGLVFFALQRIFPRLSGWTVTADASDGIDADAQAPFTAIALDAARIELAQSVLVLNESAALPEELLIDAALFGVPCVGAAVPAQRALWPALSIASPFEAVIRARALLTNSAWAKRVVEDSRRACEQVYGPDVDAAAQALRRLNEQRRMASSAEATQ